MDANPMMIFAGSGSQQLTEKICRYLQVSAGKNEVIQFSDGNTFVRVLENVRGRHVYIVQSTIFPTNDNFMELLFWIDALKRASAESVTAVIPYLSYAKGDKKDEPRVSIRARVCADAIEAAGADRVVTMDLHAAQIQGFFRIPVDNLYAHRVLCQEIEKMNLRDIVIVAPDTGFAKDARRYASYLRTSVAIADKRRPEHDEESEILEIIGEVSGKTAVIVDDFTISGGTLINVSTVLMERGAKEVYAVVSHGVLAEHAALKIDGSPITRLLATDTVENHPNSLPKKVQFVSVAPLFGEAIRRIHNRESISAMFPDSNNL